MADTQSSDLLRNAQQKLTDLLAGVRRDRQELSDASPRGRLSPEQITQGLTAFERMIDAAEEVLGAIERDLSRAEPGNVDQAAPVKPPEAARTAKAAKARQRTKAARPKRGSKKHD